MVRHISTELVLHLKVSENFIEADDGPFNGSTTIMVGLGTYIFKDLNTGKIKPEESFTNDYVEEVYESEHVHTTTKLLRVIFHAKYEKSDLHKVMENKCQYLTMTQRKELLKLLQKFEECFDGTLGIWKTDSVDFELKEDVKPICLRPNPVPKIHEEMFKDILNIQFY